MWAEREGGQCGSIVTAGCWDVGQTSATASQERKNILQRDGRDSAISRPHQITQLPSKRQKQENGLILEPDTGGESQLCSPWGCDWARYLTCLCFSLFYEVGTAFHREVD